MGSQVRKYQRILLMRMHSLSLEEVKHPHHVYPPLPLKYMEALIKQDGYFDVLLLDTWLMHVDEDQLVSKIKDWAPDVTIIMANPVDSQSSFEVGEKIKEITGCFLVAVGQEVALNWQRFLSEESPFHVALPGETEIEVLNMLKDLNTDGADAVMDSYRSVKKGLDPFAVEDLNSLPYPTYTREEIESYCFSAYPLRMAKNAKWGFVLSSRGCPYTCYFCSPIMRKTYGHKYRTRSAKNVVDEIEHLMKLGINVISFEDDDLTAKKDHVRGICREIKKRILDIKWICHARIDELDYTLMEEMKEAGCILLRLGVESGSERILKLFEKNPKNKDWRVTCQKIFSYARKLGIATNALVIIGSPDETAAEIESTISLTISLNPDIIQVHFFTLYPGSPAYDDYKNHVPREEVSRMHHYNLPIINLSQVSDEELWKLRGKFYKRFFFRPSFVLYHLYHYAPFYLSNPKVFQQLSKVTGIL